MTRNEPQPARERFDLTDPSVGGVRSLASRYFLCGDLAVVAAALLALAVGTFVVVLSTTTLSVVDAVPGGPLLYLVAALVAFTFLRLPSRTEQRTHGQSGTGFAEVRRVRGLLRAGTDLGPADQEVADDLARVCARRAAQLRPVTLVAVVVVVVFGGILLKSLDSNDANAALSAATSLVVVLAVLVTERRRTSAVRADLLGPGRPRRD